MKNMAVAAHGTELNKAWPTAAEQTVGKGTVTGPTQTLVVKASCSKNDCACLCTRCVYERGGGGGNLSNQIAVHQQGRSSDLYFSQQS